MTLGLAFNYTLAPGLSGFYRSTFTGEFGRTGATLSTMSCLWMQFLEQADRVKWLSSCLGCPCMHSMRPPWEDSSLRGSHQSYIIICNRHPGCLLKYFLEAVTLESLVQCF